MENNICPNNGIGIWKVKGDQWWECKRPKSEARWLKRRSGSVLTCPCGWVYKWKEKDNGGNEDSMPENRK
jgi:hypothetical protein